MSAWPSALKTKQKQKQQSKRKKNKIKIVREGERAQTPQNEPISCASSAPSTTEALFHFVRTSVAPLPCIPPPELVKGFSCILHPLAGGWLLLLLLSSCAIGSSIYRFILCAVRKCFIYMWTRLAAKLYLNMRSRQSPSHPPPLTPRQRHNPLHRCASTPNHCDSVYWYMYLGCACMCAGAEHTFRRSWNSVLAFDWVERANPQNRFPNWHIFCPILGLALPLLSRSRRLVNTILIFIAWTGEGKHLQSCPTWECEKFSYIFSIVFHYNIHLTWRVLILIHIRLASRNLGTLIN